MRAENNTSSSNSTGGGESRLHSWGSPMPYFFVSLAFMLGLIATVMVTLLCSNPRRRDQDQSQSQTQGRELMEGEEPKIVVIMAGDDNPTYLAEPTHPTFNNDL
ncbi:putative Glutamine dumper 2 [Tripterygium wilfordii]|uniref:Putative Glutamine dumper 2 n=1 Tax=Tripterygium wilfordii TaxID=458696 RepID=A0A7J7CNH6_TRIWF|nr:protein GLUTAMINE DUMPER 5-like [Tripterygium wilfordii]KAF5735643.1 putative Glutamine dumper 2 [Tripterygium wilfordii]